MDPPSVSIRRLCARPNSFTLLRLSKRVARAITPFGQWIVRLGQVFVPRKINATREPLHSEHFSSQACHGLCAVIIALLYLHSPRGCRRTATPLSADCSRGFFFPVRASRLPTHSHSQPSSHFAFISHAHCLAIRESIFS